MKYFDSAYKNIPLDNHSIDQDLLNISNKYKSNPLPWNGQFSPQLVQILLYKYASKEDKLFDPFLGSGTSLLEAGEYGISACGTEINYAAVCLSRVYELINMDFAERIMLLNSLENELIENGLIFRDSVFGNNSSNNPIEKIEQMLDSGSDRNTKIILEAFIILIDLYKRNYSSAWFEQKWYKIKELIKSLPVSKKAIKVLYGDSRDISLNTSSFSFVITSPPYINVFNYHQQYRSSSEYLSGSVLHTAQAEIGSNRKHRSNRFFTVVQYCMDMGLVFKELDRICKNNSKIIFIVGRESSVKKTPFYNGEIVSEIAYRICGMNLECRQERVFTNRYGIKIYEDILHFTSNKAKIDSIEEETRKLGLEILVKSEKRAPKESLDDLFVAIDHVNDINFSPIMKPIILRG